MRRKVIRDATGVSAFRILRPRFQRLNESRHRKLTMMFLFGQAAVFLIFALLSKLIKPFSFLFPTFIKNSLNLMPNRIPLRKIKSQRIYPSLGKKTIARVALLTGCVQRVISPEINESTIRLLNRHEVEVVVLPEIDCCGSLNHHLGKKD